MSDAATIPQQEAPPAPANEAAGEAQQQAPDTGQKGPSDAPSDAPRTFTQEDIDRAVSARLARAKAQWKTEVEEEAKKASMSEAERVQAEAQKAVEAAGQQTANLKARLVAAEAKAAALAAGVKPERVDYAIKLAELGAAMNDEGEVDRGIIADAIKQVVADLPELTGGAPAPAPRSGGDFGSGSAGDGKRVWRVSEIRALASDPAEFAKHEADIDAAMQTGRVIRD